MQNIIIDQPYRFVPPCHSRFWPALFQFGLPWYLRKRHGIADAVCRGTELLRASLAQGHGVLLAPNHCRPCDPMVLGLLGRAVRRPFHVMASSHLFRQGRLQAWLLTRLGAFSVYREGLDREALKMAIDILKQARRPLVIFPEGMISRTNDRIGSLRDGTAFIARAAARQRAAATPPQRVVVHPVALRYFFEGDLTAALTPVLSEIEARLSWRPQNEASILERIAKVGGALLALKEMEHLGQPYADGVPERLGRLIDHLLLPLEKEWVNGQREGDVVARVKRLRSAILPEMITGEITETERARRWRHLADLYLAQQLSCYPPDYIRAQPTPERILETVERFEEDLTDRTRVHHPLRVVIEVGPALAVSPDRERGAADPLMPQVREQLENLLARLARESTAVAAATRAEAEAKPAPPPAPPTQENPT